LRRSEGSIRNLLDDVVRASTDEICAAIKDIFEDTRSVTEPAGALALAGLKRYITDNNLIGAGKRFVVVVSGANMNFDRLRFVADRAEFGEGREAMLSVEIPEGPGSFYALHSIIHPRAVTEFIYRYDDPVKALVLVGFHLNTQDRKTELEEVLDQLKKAQFTALNISDNELAKTHARFMIGGRQVVQDERVFRFGKWHNPASHSASDS